MNHRPLFDRVSIGDTVIGKTTKRPYTVEAISRIESRTVDCICLRNVDGDPVYYSQQQFNYHFKAR